MTNVETTRRLVDAWNSKDIERICSFLHDDFQNHQLPLPTVYGVEAYREHLHRWFAAYPDLAMEIVSLFGDGDLVCLELRGRGTPAEQFFGVDPGSNRVNCSLDVLEFRDRKVWRERGYWDFSLWTGHTAPTARPRNR